MVQIPREPGKVVQPEVETKGPTGIIYREATDKALVRRPQRVRQTKARKPDTCTEGMDVDATVISVKITRLVLGIN